MSWEDKSPADLVPALQEMAADAATRFGLALIQPPKFLRLGENASFQLTAPEARHFLRIHRPGYHGQAAIRSELFWLAALRTAGIPTPHASPGADGDFVQTVERPGLGSHSTTLFDWIDGEPPQQGSDSANANALHLLGRTMALVHEATRAWPLPPSFTRPRWDRDGLTGASPVWGPIARDPDWPPEDLEALDRTVDLVDRRLASYPTAAEHFGLIHADLQAGNLLIAANGSPTLLDFDDSGFGWYAYDIASSLWLLEDHPRFGELRDAMLTGYSEVRPVPALATSELATFLMARRLAWLSWVESRAHTPHAREQRKPRGDAIRRALHRYLETTDV